MYTILSGQLGAFKQLELIANNLANMNTTGFKSENLLFEQALSSQQSLVSAGAMRSDVDQPSTLNANEFVGIRGSFTDLAQGPIEISGNPLDAAIEGKGFFVVSTPEGERYTRAGNFSLDATGRLVTPDGHAVQGSGGDITISGQTVKIEHSGNVTVDGVNAGTLRVVDIAAQDLERDQALRFKLRAGGSVQEVTNAHVMGGAIEGSNVNAVRELTNMIIVSRMYDSFAQARESSSSMSRELNDRVSQTRG